jgi:CDP-4-dehydro-6-deoxyglucose reductase
VFEADDRFEFTPGQFVSLSEDIGGKKVTRAYSIASAPDGRRFELCLNEVKDGHFSPHLFGMRPGDTVEMQGPLGYFVPRSPVSDSVFVAVGTGIAPFRSMLLSPALFDSGRKITLLMGARHEHGLLYRDEFQQLAAQRQNFRFIPTLTRPPEGWAGYTGRVQPHLLELIGERRDIDVYVCGMKEMVDDVRRILKERGVDRKRIIYEKYD